MSSKMTNHKVASVLERTLYGKMEMSLENLIEFKEALEIAAYTLHRLGGKVMPGWRYDKKTGLYECEVCGGKPKRIFDKDGFFVAYECNKCKISTKFHPYQDDAKACWNQRIVGGMKNGEFVIDRNWKKTEPETK